MYYVHKHIFRLFGPRPLPSYVSTYIFSTESKQKNDPLSSYFGLDDTYMNGSLSKILSVHVIYFLSNFKWQILKIKRI